MPDDFQAKLPPILPSSPSPDGDRYAEVNFRLPEESAWRFPIVLVSAFMVGLLAVGFRFSPPSAAPPAPTLAPVAPAPQLGDLKGRKEIKGTWIVCKLPQE